jgi:hypothetical protein
MLVTARPVAAAIEDTNPQPASLANTWSCCARYRVDGSPSSDLRDVAVLTQILMASIAVDPCVKRLGKIQTQAHLRASRPNGFVWV